MYVYYIVMEIHVFLSINVFSPFYCLYITSMPHHYFTMDFTLNPKPFKIKISIPFVILFHEGLHSHNNLFLSNEGVFQRSQTCTYILTKRKLNKKF
jgi:hypothetical protein